MNGTGHAGMRLHYVVTAGPTREYLDAVRFLSNPSSGKMGFAVARRAARLGHRVTLIAGPGVQLRAPDGVRRVDVTSARDLLAAVEAALAEPGEPTVLVMTAAVADWRPARTAAGKLKKSGMSSTLELVRNPDVLATVGRRRRAEGGRFPVIVGFAAETGDPVAEGLRKCREKGADFVVANDVSADRCGFGADRLRVTFVSRSGTSRRVAGDVTKRSLAARIVMRADQFAANPRAEI